MRGMFFKVQDIIGYNPHIALVQSQRGLRKTHNSVLFAARQYATKGAGFIYARRSQVEIDISAFSLFAAHEKYGDLPIGAFRVVGDNIVFNRKAWEAQIYNRGGEVVHQTEPQQRDKKLGVKIKTSDRIGEGDEYAGNVMAISTAHNKKSTAYPNVQNLIFDEYLTATGSYLKNEPFKFESMLETIFRDRKKMFVLMLANTVSELDPYCDYWRVKPSKSETTFYKDRRLLIYRPFSQSFKEHKLDTPMGKLVSKSKGGEHIIDNKPVADNTANIIRQPKDCQPHFNVVVNGMAYGVYYCWIDGAAFFISSKPSEEKGTLTTDKEVYENCIRVAPSVLRKKFEGRLINNAVYFSSLAVKEAAKTFLY